MKEILYIQAGQLANYTGAHFWNTQESYLSADDDLVAHETSFREGTKQEGNCFTPRVIVIGKKDHFGTAARTHSSIQRSNGAEANTKTDLWNGDVLEYRADAIPTSSALEDDEDAEETDKPREELSHSVRYWADFSRVYYTPKSFQMVPDVYDFEATDGGWKAGEANYRQFDEDVNLMEDSVRPFLEECDSIQGIQLMNDTATFGPFIHSFLTEFRDELVKLPCLSFPFLSNTLSWNPDVDDKTGMRRIINDALYLRAITEYASLTIPIQNPALWRKNRTKDRICDTSAIISAHIESITLPLRFSNARDDIASFSAQFNCFNPSSPFAEINGCFPAQPDGLKGLLNYSQAVQFDANKKLPIYTRRDVSRGFEPPYLDAYERWSNKLSTPDVNITRSHNAGFPVPRGLADVFGVQTPEPTARVFSSLCASPDMGNLFKEYASFVHAASSRRRDVFFEGDEVDELKELVNDLWTIHDSLSVEDGDRE